MSQLAITAEQRRARLPETVDASRRAVDLVRTRNIAGLTNVPNMLDSPRPGR